MASTLEKENMSLLGSIAGIATRAWQIVLPLGGEFGGSKIELTPLPDEVLNKTVAEILANPPALPKLRL